MVPKKKHLCNLVKISRSLEGISLSPESGRSCNSEHLPSNSILPLVYQKLIEAKIPTFGNAFPAK